MLNVDAGCNFVPVMEEGQNQGVKLPTRFIRIGETFERYGITLECVAMPMDTCPAAACRGCFFRRSRIGDTVINCNDIQCSSWDRMDKKNVWFVPKGEK